MGADSEQYYIEFTASDTAALSAPIIWYPNVGARKQTFAALATLSKTKFTGTQRVAFSFRKSMTMAQAK